MGELSLSPSEFTRMTPREANLAIKGYNNRVKADYYNTERAFYNVYGMFNIKNFKPDDPFNNKKNKMDKQRGYKKTSLKEREETLSYLFNK